jgi:putative DNA primase/helicase
VLERRDATLGAETADNGPAEGPPEFTDSGNALEFAKDHADTVRWTQSHGWLVWDGRRWKADETLAIVELGKKTAARMMEEAKEQYKAAADLVADAADSDDELEKREAAAAQKRAKQALANAKYCRQKKGLDAMIALARSLSGIAVRFDQFDSQHHLLNVLNGTIDLMTRTLRPHDKADHITRLAPVKYEPAANAPTFDRYLTSTFNKDGELIGWLHSFLGSCLTGETKDELLVVFWGGGSNGKSKLVELILSLMGDYAWKAPAEMLLARKQDQHSEERASLCGRRFVAASETDQGRRLNEGLVKELTGSDTMSARFLYRDRFNFQPTWKLVLSTNYRPQIRGNDHGIWRRIKLVPFTQRFWKPDEPPGPEELRADKDLGEKLKAEHSGILAWLVLGAADWYANGLPKCKAIEQSTEAYRSAEDMVQQFIDQRVEMDPKARVRGREIYAAFKAWHEAEGMPGQPLTGTVFGTRLGELVTAMGGSKNDKTSVYSGIKLRDLYSDDEGGSRGS